VFRVDFLQRGRVAAGGFGSGSGLRKCDGTGTGCFNGGSRGCNSNGA
jgi:hypothetical protein